MARTRTRFRCSSCDATTPRWAGRCPQCGDWNTLGEEAVPVVAPAAPGAGAAAAAGLAGTSTEPVELTGAVAAGAPPVATGVRELDRVLGGGLVPGSVTLIGGEPGIGKSTLLLQALAAMAAAGRSSLLVAAEEAPDQVRRRGERLGSLVPGMWVTAGTSMPEILAAVARVRPDVVVVDSVQAVADPTADSSPGSVLQVRACSHALAAVARAAGGPAVVLVGHVTKDGTLAGPRVLEHLVDTVLAFEGDRHHALRTLRALKHRFGPTGELGLFEMSPAGLTAVADPGTMLLADRRPFAPGSVAFAALDGRRPLLVEIQALVAPAAGPPRRSVSGYDTGRLTQLLAVLERRVGLDFRASDAYVSVVGGLRLGDPGADLAVALALVSSMTERPVAEATVVVGEVGLGGEVRHVAQTPRRLAEAARLGFTRAVVPTAGIPAGAGAAVPGLDVDPVGTVHDALERHLGRPRSAPRLRLMG